MRLFACVSLMLLLSACGRPETAAVPLNQPAARQPAPTAAPALAQTAVVAAPTVVPLAATAVPPAPLPDGYDAPDFVGGQEWLNSKPLTLADLRGKVVLVDFWTYSCYNCRNTLPALRGWWAKYKDQGLVIVGVHTPEFSSEHELDNVRKAVADQEIGWPVIQDNDSAIWRSYNNHYWPHMYLVDSRGKVIYDHIGEGAYDTTEQWIQTALANR